MIKFIDDSLINDDIYVLVFSASWVNNSNFSKNINKIESEFSFIKFILVDVDISYVLVKKYNVERLPSIIIVKNGLCEARLEGVSLITPLRTFFRKIKFEKEEIMENIKNNVELSGEALLIWNEIRQVDLNLFALPGQILENHATVIPFSDKELYLILKSTAVLPALEQVLGSKFSVQQTDRYTIISRA